MISRLFPTTALRCRWPLLALWLLCAGSTQAATPVVVASIRPLQLLAAAITDGISTPGLVMEPGQDPHHLSLRPSERQKLQQADIVLWVGPILELPLDKVIAQLQVPVVTAQHASGITLLHTGTVADPHLWLDSHNARRIAAALLQVLLERDAEHAARYQANMAHLSEQLDILDAEIDRQLQPLLSQPWAVSHQAFGYFAAQHKLQPPFALTDATNATPGMQRVLQLRQQIATQNIKCLLTEPSENHQQLDTMMEGHKLSIITADVLGTTITPAAGAYAQLLLQVASALEQCMGGPNG
jgi:zinc transport system substrate-binding protein